MKEREMPSNYDVPPESPFALLNAEETRAWYAYMKVQLRLRYEMNRQLRDDSGLSLADYDVLVALTSADGGTMTVSDLAIRIGAERSRVSHQVRRLAGDALVTASPNADDRRATDVSLTSTGRELLLRASPGHIDFVRGVFFDALEPHQRDVIAQVFEKIYDRLIGRGTLPRPADHP
jgi:DNA-binding MarR family transcriptional regulator